MASIAASQRLAPFVPSPQPMVDQMLALAEPGRDDSIYDLGSGNGQIVITAAERFGARATGIEIDPDLVKLSSARIAAGGLAARAQIVHGDFLDADLRPATIVTLYQLPAVNELLRPLLEAQLRPGTRVVSLDFPVPGWSAARVVTATLPDSSQHAIYLYSIGQTPEVTVAVQRGYASERFALELDGASVGLVKSVEGGAVSADVVTEKFGPDGIAHKHVAGVHYDDITLTCGTGMSKVFYSWIDDTLNQRYSRKNGAIVGADFNYREVSRLSFQQALVSEIGFPAMDAGSKEAASLTVTIAPEYTRRTTSLGPQIATTGQATKQLLQANFRLAIVGLDCTMVTAIDAIAIRQATVEDPLGELRVPQQDPGYLEIPNLAVVLAESHAESFYDWLDDFVIKGNSGVSGEKTGTLEYLAPNRQDALFTLDFHGLGIFKLTPVKVESGRESARLVRAEMYCEEISFKYGAAAVSEPTSAGGTKTTSTKTASKKTRDALPSRASALAWKESAARSLDAETASVPAEIPGDLVAARRGPGLKFRT